MRFAFRIGCVVITAFLAGCFSYTPARGPRVVDRDPPPMQWPPVDASALEPLRDHTPPLIYHAKLLPGVSLTDLKNDDQRAMVTQPEYTVKRNEIVDGTLVRMYEKRTELPALDYLFVGFVANGSVLSPHDVTPGNWQLKQMRSAEARAQANKVWESSGLERDPVEDEIAIDEGIPFRLPSDQPQDCKGIVLHLWALGGNDYEQAVADEVRSRGWLVVDIHPHTSAPAELGEGVPDQIIALEKERDGLSAELPHVEKGESMSHYSKRVHDSPAAQRQREIWNEIAELRNPPVPLCAQSDVADAAGVVATRIDRALTENAAATRAVLETARRVYPSLRNAPVVVMGFSAGALSTPTVAAMLGEDVKAVVIVGGAANAVAVAQRSIISKGGLRLQCSGNPAPKDLVDNLEREYLAHSKFDGYHAAPLLADRPVLVVDAGMDTWVPSELGELLYEQLGYPDRLHMALGGHEMLFYFLPRRARWIADWVDDHVPSRTAWAGPLLAPVAPASGGAAAR
jgi:hypothetical protein